MLGATVMPHVVYLHSALVQHRVKEDSFHCPTNQWLRTLRHLHYELVDVLAAMDDVTDHILETYRSPNLDLRARGAEPRVDILRAFSGACRKDLQRG